MKKYYITLFFLVIMGGQVFSQDRGLEYFLVVNTNLYLPGAQANKGLYPIIGYDKESQPKLLIGGFGFGVAAFKPLAESLSLMTQMNLSKHTYWDEPVELRGSNNGPLGQFLAGSSDYAFGITGTLHYYIGRKMSIGTGLGAQLFTVTLSRVPKFVDFKFAPDAVSINRYYRQCLPTIPLEWSVKGDKLLFNIRYEYGLTNRYKKPLSESKSDRFSLLFFELGLRLK